MCSYIERVIIVAMSPPVILTNTNFLLAVRKCSIAYNGRSFTPSYVTNHIVVFFFKQASS